jgi:hypothetical protein
MRPLQRQLPCRAVVWELSLPDPPGRRSLVLGKKSHYFNELLTYREFECAGLMKRQISQKRQIDADCAGEVIVNRVRVLIGPVGEFEQRQRKIGGNGQVEFGLTEGGNHDGAVADAARDLLPAHIQFRVQPVHRQRAVIGILNVELDRKILLQQIPAAQLNANQRDIGPVEFGRHQRTSA